MKIKQLIFILFIVLSVIPLTFLGVTNMFYYNNKLENILENDLRIAVSTQVKAIENFFEERKSDASVIIGYQVVNDLWDAVQKNDNQRLLELQGPVNDLLNSRVQNNRFVESITLLDDDFIVVACSDETALGQKSTLNVLEPHYLTPDMQFTHVIETQREGRRKRILAAVQEIYGDTALAGYIVLEINLSFFEEVRVSASLFNNGTIYLLDGKGNLISAGDTRASRDNYVLSSDEQSDFYRAWSERDPGSPRGVLRYRAQGDHYMSCYSRFPDMDWTIISSVNIDQVLQKKAGYRDLLVIVVAVLVILLITVNLFVSQNVAAPIKGMIEKFQYIKKTQDYGVRMEQSKNNEFGIISKEINSLLSHIENYMALEREKHAQLKDKAERDPLTGLYNKATIEKLLREALTSAQASGIPVTCLFLDVDDFKRFNTEHGHIGGDRVLQFIASNLSACTKGFAGRGGGDEFIAFLSGETNAGNIELLLQNLIGVLNDGVVLEDKGPPVPIYCSIGAAFTNGAAMSYEELIAQADEAMYKVKHEHKNGYIIWRPPQ